MNMEKKLKIHTILNTQTNIFKYIIQIPTLHEMC